MRLASTACIAVVVCSSTWTYAAQDCPDCGAASPHFQDAAWFLESQGLPTHAWEVLCAWQETAPHDAGVSVHGYRVQTRDGGESFDLYYDLAGVALDSRRLAELGIREKDWRVRAVSAEAREVRASSTKGAARPAIPVGALLGAEAYGAKRVHVLDLPAVDMAAIRAEDAAAAGDNTKGPLRTGVFQDFPHPIRLEAGRATVGEWRPLPDGGWLWHVSIRSPGATGQRLRIGRLQVPEGAQVVVYSTNEPTEVYGPLETHSFGAGELWTPTCFSDIVTVECYVPTDAARTSVRLEIDRSLHMYADPATLLWGAAHKAAGACNLDVTCYPDWAETAAGVGGVGSIGLNGSLYCTGTLIASADPAADGRLFLSAEHCRGGRSIQDWANNLEVYWFYQTNSCNGVPPDPATVPRTIGGAQHLASGSGTDFVLVRLRNAPPAGVVAAGWFTGHVSIGLEVVGIHHPRGSFKRISFGATRPMTSGRFSPSDTYFAEVGWNEGTTEPGSSGSGLFLNGARQLVGQLYGGRASCEQPSAPDWYGRFSHTYPLIESFLTPPDSRAPAAGFIANKTAGGVPLTIEFQDRSDPGSHPITEWRWEFGNRSGATSVEANPQFTYRRHGAYTVSLTVTSAVGSHTAVMENYILAGSGVAGDVTGSGVVNAVDVQLVVNQALGLDIGEHAEQADLDENGVVNAVDVQLVINASLGQLRS